MKTSEEILMRMRFKNSSCKMILVIWRWRVSQDTLTMRVTWSMMGMQGMVRKKMTTPTKRMKLKGVMGMTRGMMRGAMRVDAARVCIIDYDQERVPDVHQGR